MRYWEAIPNPAWDVRQRQRDRRIRAARNGALLRPVRWLGSGRRHACPENSSRNRREPRVEHRQQLPGTARLAPTQASPRRGEELGRTPFPGLKFEPRSCGDATAVSSIATTTLVVEECCVICPVPPRCIG